FDLTLIANGFPLADARAEFNNILSIPAKDYDSHLSNARKAIADHHLEHNPYYRKLAINADSADWNSLPILTKANLQVPLAHRLSDGYSENSIYVNKTSGSS